MFKKNVYVAGHNGMVGSAICRHLELSDERTELITQSRQELDLTCQKSTQKFFNRHSIDEVYLAGAKVGGIFANNEFPAEFIYDNLMIEANVINGAYQSGISKLLFLGSSCIYPKLSDQPINENSLLTGVLEATNEPYAIAKIAGIKLCESYNRQYGVDFRSVMPTNLYGPNDNFHPDHSHVIPAMMRRFHKAKLNSDSEVLVWGTGKPMREFLHVDDMAAACVYVMNMPEGDYYSTLSNPMSSHLNVGTGLDCTIRELAETMVDVVGFEGELKFDTDKPDGTPRKLLDVEKIAELGWRASMNLKSGLKSTYVWFLENENTLRI